MGVKLSPLYLYDMIYLKNLLLLTEGWKTYRISSNPKVLLYDFYVLSYLTTLPISSKQKGFSGNLIGRNPEDLAHDIEYAQSVLLPVLLKQMKRSLFFAVCAEMRHVFDRSQDFSLFKDNKLLKYYWRYYKQFGGNVPDEFKMNRNVPNSRVIPASESYDQSYKAAMLAIKKAGKSTVAFAELAAELFTEADWDSHYGGPKWTEIAEGYIMLCKATTNNEKQIAIDHAYDLEHNSGTALNKVRDFEIKGSYEWISKALDHKRDAESIYDLLPHCSSDMRKLALEAFKVANVRTPTNQSNLSIEYKTFNKGDIVSINNGKLEGIIIANSIEVPKQKSPAYQVQITKNNMPPSDAAYPVGATFSMYSHFLTLVKPNPHVNSHKKKLKIGNLVTFQLKNKNTNTTEGYTGRLKAVVAVNAWGVEVVKIWDDYIHPLLEIGDVEVLDEKDLTILANQYQVGDSVKFQISPYGEHYVGTVLSQNGNGPETEYEIEITSNTNGASLSMGSVVFIKESKLSLSDPYDISDVFQKGDLVKFPTINGYLIGKIINEKQLPSDKTIQYSIRLTDVSHDYSGVFGVGETVYNTKFTMKLIEKAAKFNKNDHVLYTSYNGNKYEGIVLNPIDEKSHDIQITNVLNAGKSTIAVGDIVQADNTSLQLINQTPQSHENPFAAPLKFHIGDLVKFNVLKGYVVGKITNFQIEEKNNKIKREYQIKLTDVSHASHVATDKLYVGGIIYALENDIELVESSQKIQTKFTKGDVVQWQNISTIYEAVIINSNYATVCEIQITKVITSATILTEPIGTKLMVPIKSLVLLSKAYDTVPTPIKEKSEYPLSVGNTINFPLIPNMGYLHQGNRYLLESISQNGEHAAIKSVATGKTEYIGTSNLAYDYSVNRAFDGNGNLLDKNKTYLYKTSTSEHTSETLEIKLIDEMASVMTTPDPKVGGTVLKIYGPAITYKIGEKSLFRSYLLLPLPPTQS